MFWLLFSLTAPMVLMSFALLLSFSQSPKFYLPSSPSINTNVNKFIFFI